MRPALGRGHRVHLVDDHRLDVAQDLALARGEHQEQALGRRDQHVGGPPSHAAPRIRRGVTGAHGHLDVAQLLARGRCHGADAGERRAQVALDVVVQGLQRREVEQCRSAAGHALLAEQAVEPGQERRERLAAARRRAHEHVLAPCDRRPGTCLSRCRGAERLLEPALRRSAERGRGRDVHGHPGTVPRKVRVELVAWILVASSTSSAPGRQVVESRARSPGRCSCVLTPRGRRSRPTALRTMGTGRLPPLY